MLNDVRSRDWPGVQIPADMDRVVHRTTIANAVGLTVVDVVPTETLKSGVYVCILRCNLAFQDSSRPGICRVVKASSPGSAAEKGGILEGDYVLLVNKIDVTKMSSTEVTALLKKPGQLSVVVLSSAISHMQEGARLLKVREKVVSRFYRVLPDCTKLAWKSRFRKTVDSFYRIGDIKEVRYALLRAHLPVSARCDLMFDCECECSLGRNTDSFARAFDTSNPRARALMGGGSGELCFSIIYGEV